ncbi:MAG TPA: DUF2306 domain-containing protein [Chthoniobacterales bacterium]
MQNPIAHAHIIAAVAALLLGAVVFLNRKGTRLHVQMGIGYVVSMLIMNVTALGIYRLTGNLNPFHVGAVFSLATVLAGWVPAIRRKPRDAWLRLHFEFMSWSYVGLVAAAFAEAGTRLPHAPFVGAVLASSIVVFLLGGMLVVRARARYFRDGAAAKMAATPRWSSCC